MRAIFAVVAWAALCVSAAAHAQITNDIAGEVITRNGAAVVGVVITAENLATGEKITAITGTSGSFSIPRLAPGRYRITAEQPGFRVVSQDVDVSLTPVPPLRLRLDVAPTTTATIKTGTLRGKVTGPTGTPIAGAKITIKHASGVSIAITTGDDGRWRRKELARGDYSVTVEAKGYVTVTLDATVGMLSRNVLTELKSHDQPPS